MARQEPTARAAGTRGRPTRGAPRPTGVDPARVGVSRRGRRRRASKSYGMSCASRFSLERRSPRNARRSRNQPKGGMNPSRDLAARFEAYADWRRRVSAGVSALHEWLQQQDLADAQVETKVQQILERLQQDKLVVAFVAEFSRGKSELINAIF